MKRELWKLAIKNCAYLILMVGFFAIALCIIASESTGAWKTNAMFNTCIVILVAFSPFAVLVTDKNDTKVRWQASVAFVLLAIQFYVNCMISMPISAEYKVPVCIVAFFVSIMIGYKYYMNKWKRWKRNIKTSKLEKIISICFCTAFFGIVIFFKVFGRVFVRAIDAQHDASEMALAAWIIFLLAGIFFGVSGGIMLAFDVTETVKRR